MLENSQYAYLYARYVRRAPWSENEEERAFFTHDDLLLRGAVEWALLYYLFVRQGQPTRLFDLWIVSKGFWTKTWVDLLEYIQKVRAEPHPIVPAIELYDPQNRAPPLIISAAYSDHGIEATMGPHAAYVRFSIITLRLRDAEPEFFYCRPELSYGLAANTAWHWHAREGDDFRWTVTCEHDQYELSEWSHHEQIFADPLTWQHY